MTYEDSGKTGYQVVAEVIGETLCLHAEHGAIFRAEVKNNTLYIG